MEHIKGLIYGDINLNIIDGSSIWLTSLINVLGINPNINIDLLLKTPITKMDVVNSIENYNNIRKIDPYKSIRKNRLEPEDAHVIIKDKDKIENYDFIFLRGFDICVEVSKSKEFKEKLICYITNYEHDKSKITYEEKCMLRNVYNNCRYYCVQTKEARESIKDILDIEDDDKFIILNPMIPDYNEEMKIGINRNNTLIYSGKFSKDWYTKEILDEFLKLKEVNKEVKLKVVGNLFRNDLNEVKDEIINEFRSNKSITWIEGTSRTESNRLIEEADIGIGWRSENIDNDNSVELSTKVLEYCRAGKPIILRRIKMYEEMFGKDYELFVDKESDFVDKVNELLNDSVLYRKCAQKVYKVGKYYTFKESYKRLHEKLIKLKRNKKNILFAGHDLKFINDFIENLRINDNYNIKIDQWKGHNSHDEIYSRECLEWADVIFCEWGLGNAKWYSNNKKVWQKLIVRMHLQERDTPYYKEFNMENIDRFIAISPYIYEEFAYKMGVPREKMRMIYNFINTDKFKNNLKMSDSKYNLGIVGVCPSRKRLDRAINILEKLVEKDNRYKLYIKGKKPEEYEWLMKRESEKKYYDEIYSQIEEKGLKDNVIFDGHGSDMNEWFRKIGYILSTSEFESFHMAPAEGMATGCVPIIFNWEGADTIHSSEFIVKNEDEAINVISNSMDHIGNYKLREYTKQKFDSQKIFLDLLAQID